MKDLRISTLYKPVYSWFLDKSKFDFFLCLPYSLAIETFLYSSFVFPLKFLGSMRFWNNAIPFRILLKKVISHLR